MSQLDWKFLQALPALTPVAAALAAGDTILEAFAKLQGQMPQPGDIKLVAYNSAAAGWLVCDNTFYSTAEHPELFAKIGYLWGGSGPTFAVPPNESPNGGIFWLQPWTSAGFVDDSLGGTAGSVYQNHTHDDHTTDSVGVLALLASALVGPTTHSAVRQARIRYKFVIKT